MSFSIQAIFDKMNEGDVLFSYKGSITGEFITDVLDEIELKLKILDIASPVRKKVYNVLVESLQNLFHHIDDIPENVKKEYSERFGAIVIARFPDLFRISTGNFINASNVGVLKSKIDKINSLSHEEIKEMYKFVLNNQKMSAKGGGGLGLIDIAKKTGNNFDYNFYEYNDNFYFFNLNISVSERRN